MRLTFAWIAAFSIATTVSSLAHFDPICAEDALKEVMRNPYLDDPYHAKRTLRSRRLEDLDETLSDRLTTLPEESVVYDFGGGYGNYATELARQGKKVTSVDLDDNLGRLLGFPLTDKTTLFDKPSKIDVEELNEILDIMNLKALEPGNNVHNKIRQLLKKVNTILLAHGIPPITELNQLPSAQARLRASLSQLEKRGHLKRIQGSVQDFLQKIPDGSVASIIDYYGAAEYSSNRLALLQVYLKKLQPGGFGAISTNDVDRVILANKRVITIEHYLTERFPDFFRYDFENEMLYIERPKEKEIPDFFSRLRPSKQHHGHLSGTSTWYIEIDDNL